MTPLQGTKTSVEMPYIRIEGEPSGAQYSNEPTNNATFGRPEYGPEYFNLPQPSEPNQVMPVQPQQPGILQSPPYTSESMEDQSGPYSSQWAANNLPFSQQGPSTASQFNTYAPWPSPESNDGIPPSTMPMPQVPHQGVPQHTVSTDSLVRMPHPEPGSPVTDEEFRQLCSNSEGGTNISQVREGRVGRPRKYELARPREQEFSGSARDIYLMAVYYYDKYHNACKNLEAAQRNLQNPTGDKGHLQKLVLKNLHLRASAKNEYLWVRQNKSSPPLSITPEDAWNKARTLREKNEEAQKKFIETEAAHSRGELSAEQMKKTLQRVKHWKDKRSKECEMLELQLKSSGASYGEPQSRPDNADIGGPSNAYQPDPDTTDATNAFTSSHPYVDPGVQMVDYSNMNPPPNGFAANQGAPYYYNQMNPPQPSPNSSLQQNLGYNNATEVQPVLVYFDSNQQLQPAVFDQNCNIDNWNMNGPNVNDTNFLDPRLNDLQAPQAPQAVQSNVVTNGVNNAPLGGNYQSPGINDNFTQDDLNVAQEQVSNTSRFTWNA